MTSASTRSLLLTLVALLPGCRAGRSDAVATLSVAMPTLTALPTSTRIDAAPHSLSAPIRIGLHGDVLLSDPRADRQLRVVDTAGVVRWLAAPKGEGPGEARMAMPLDLSDTSLMAFDLATHRMTEWDSSGRMLRTTAALPRTPLALVGPDSWLGWEPDQPRYGVVLLDAEGHSREVLDHGEAAYVEMFPAVRDPRMIVPPTLGTWQGGFVVANGAKYVLALYDWNGGYVRTLRRELPENHYSEKQADAELGALAGRPGQRTDNQELRRAEVMARVRPWFTHVTPLGLDAAGRIWVVGQQGDTTFADVFTAAQFVGRVVLPCDGFQGRWAMRGNWLALVCAPDDPAAAVDAVVKRWRVG